MNCTIVHTPTLLAVHSPYNRDFAYYAGKLLRGTWDKIQKLWIFTEANLESVQGLCHRFYQNVVVADTVPQETPRVAGVGFYGVVGAMARVLVTVERKHVFSGQFGQTTVYTFRDAENKIFTWFSTSDKVSLGVGGIYTIEGKIKKHENYKGDDQTVLTRCKVLT